MGTKSLIFMELTAPSYSMPSWLQYTCIERPESGLKPGLIQAFVIERYTPSYWYLVVSSLFLYCT